MLHKKFKGKFAFLGNKDTFDILSIKINNEYQICYTSNKKKQTWPSLEFLQATVDKSMTTTSPVQNKKPIKISKEERKIICGYVKKNPLPGVEETIATPGRFPWVVGINRIFDRSESDRMTYYKCGGTIIDEDHILTTASCMHEDGLLLDKSEIEIETSPFTLSEKSNVKTYKVDKIMIHDSYNKLLEYNFAIIKLKKLIEFNDFASPICYPMNMYNIIGGQSAKVRLKLFFQ